MLDLSNPIYSDDAAAREYLESVRWPDGPVCPHCGCMERVARVGGETARAGLLRCNDCGKQFTVTVGTVYESSHIPLGKWHFVTHMMAASKKGISAMQVHRMLGITYKSAWFMCHRIREAMTTPDAGPIGGKGKTVEADETYIGGKAKNRKNHVPPKVAVVALVERGGEVRARKVARVNAKTLRPVLVENASRKSNLVTDESTVYPKIGDEFASHEAVNHSAEEYVRGSAHTNTVEGYFSILKRGVIGTYHHWSEQHLDRYVTEFSFRYNTRKATDEQRAEAITKGIVGKRLTYRRTNVGA